MWVCVRCRVRVRLCLCLCVRMCMRAFDFVCLYVRVFVCVGVVCVRGLTPLSRTHIFSHTYSLAHTLSHTHTCTHDRSYCVAVGSERRDHSSVPRPHLGVHVAGVWVCRWVGEWVGAREGGWVCGWVGGSKRTTEFKPKQATRLGLRQD